MNEEKQKQRAELRERYIRMLTAFSGKEIDLTMYEKTNVRGKFVAMKADNTHFAVDFLQTPIGVVNHAVLRCKDTIALTANLGDLVAKRYKTD